MTTAVFRPAPIPLHRPWWQRLLAELRAAHELMAQRDLERDIQHALAGLSEKTLRDIGAPEWMHEIDRSEELRRLERPW